MIKAEIRDRLRVSGPGLSEIEKEESLRAIHEGLEMLRRDGYYEINLRLVVWRLMQDAATTEARLPNRERSWLMSASRAMWPEMARPSEECRAIEWDDAMAVLTGKQVESVIGGRRAIIPITDPGAVRRMLTVLGWLKYAKGKNPKRDRSIFLMRARGVPTREICRAMHGRIGDRAIDMVKDKVLKHVVAHLSLLDIAEICGKMD
jgi:hypothetical protein